MKTGDEHFTIYQGSALELNHHKTKKKNVFVFDLDETIGSFAELYHLFQCIQYIQDQQKKLLYGSVRVLLFSLLDIYPEFFRYGIEILFQYLNEKKKGKQDVQIYIYTNNHCLPTSWTSHIIAYMEAKWKVPKLIDNILCAFKVKGKIVECRRTTSDKTYDDLIQCIRLGSNTELCFVDNIYFPKMKQRMVYYLRPKAYYHYVNRKTIIERFILSKVGMSIITTLRTTKENLRDEVVTYYAKHNLPMTEYYKSEKEMEIDLNVSKKLLYHCRLFFHIHRKQCTTRKCRKIKGAKVTKKRRPSI